MANEMKVIHDIATGEVIEREMTEAEKKQYNKDLVNIAQGLKLEEEKASAKIALLDRLGITEDEARLLLG
jgi:hypothetical protein